METALFSNRIVPVGVFQRLRKSPDERATCPVCEDEVFLSAANSVVKTASFNHLPRSDDEERCPLSYPYHPSYSWLQNVELEVIQLRADRLKSQFYEADNLKRAFTFLTTLTGKGAVNSSVFALLLRKADQFDIWQYAGLPVWAVPYILLTFTDFVVRRPSKRAYVLRFIIDKPSRSKLNTTWLNPGQCALLKYFVNGGKATKLFGAGQGQGRQPSMTASTFLAVPNPLPFSEQEYLRITSDTSWISSGLQNLLQEMAMVASVEPLSPAADSAVPPAKASTNKAASHKDEAAPIRRRTSPQSSPGSESIQITGNGVRGESVVSLPQIVNGTDVRAEDTPRDVKKEGMARSDERATPSARQPETKTKVLDSNESVDDTVAFTRPESDWHIERIEAPTIAAVQHGESGASSSKIGTAANVAPEPVGTKSKDGFWAWLGKILR